MAVAAASSWAEPPTDILWKIIERLPLVDYLRFAAVCISWRSALAERRCGPAPHPPWLMLPCDDTGTSPSFRFLNMIEKREYQMNLPQIQGRWCIGSSEGWLIWLDDVSELNVFDPLSTSRIYLPSVTTFPDVDSVSHGPDGQIDGYFCSLPLQELYRSNDMVGMYFSKVIMSPGSTTGSYMAAAIHSWPEKLAVVRQGDEGWTVIDTPDNGFFDIVFHNGLLYGVTFMGKVMSCDVSNPSDPRVEVWGPEFATSDCPKYLVVSAGELLQVWRKVRNFPTDYERAMGQAGLNITTRFSVFKMDVVSNSWVKVKDLGNHALFLGHNSSISMSTCDFPELRRNCIYFTDDNKVDYLHTPRQTRDLGVYNLEDGSVEPFYPTDSKLNWPPPIWFTPTLL